MTREAIKELNTFKIGAKSELGKNALDMAIKALEQQPCEDAISRKALYKALYERFHEEDAPNNITEVRLGTIRNFVKDFPSVTPTQRWIPVSERLPKETGWYLITFKVYGGGYAVCEMSYRKPEDYWTQNDIGKKILDNDEVVAWMPLPQPYKTESEDKE